MENFKTKVNPYTGQLQKVFDSEANDLNIMLNAFRIAINGSLTRQNMVDGSIDEFEDETGIDGVNSLNEAYNSADDYYEPDRVEAGIDAYCVLMLHCNGTDGSTTFTDDSDSAHTVTAFGTAQLDTAIKKFGTAAGLLDGDSDAITIPDHADFEFGSDDFTVDLWTYIDTLPGIGAYNTLVGKFETGSQRSWILNLTNDAGTYKWQVSISTDGSNSAVAETRTTSLSTGTWYHIALVRNGNNLMIFQDGSQVGANIDVTGITFYNSNARFCVGAYTTTASGGNPAGNWWNGSFDEVRVSKGIARWTSNFTPPSQEYGDVAEIYNMTLISEAVIAESGSNLGNGRIVVFEEDVDSITLNTDIKAFISRDDGTTWSEITLANEGKYSGDKRILSGTVDISGQPAGVDMKYKVTTHNNKDLKLHGVGLLWD